MVHSHRKRALDVAARQDGVLTRRHARSIGMNDRMVDACIADGLFVPLSRETYRVAGAPQTERMAVVAAVLSSRGHASDATASKLMQLDAPVPVVPIQVTVEAGVRQPRVTRVAVGTPGRSFYPVRTHRRKALGEPLLEIDGITCTDAARTLIDIAPMLALDDLEDAFERARKLRLVSIEALARRFERLGGRGRSGTPKIRELLESARPGVLDSKLEGKAWRMLRRSCLPEPDRQHRIDISRGRRYRLDFAWPDLMVAFETEGFEWHGSRARWKADRIRVAALERLGWRHIVATWDDVVFRPEETLARVAAAIGERRQLVWSA